MDGSAVRRRFAPAVLLFSSALLASGCGVKGRVSLATLAAPPAAAEEKPAPPVHGGLLRIGLTRLSGSAALGAKLTAPGRLADASRKKLAVVPAGKPVQLVADFAANQVLAKGPGFQVRSPELSLSGGLVRIGGRSYPGTVHVRLAGTGLHIVNELDIEQYLAGVLPGEIPRYFGVEAQKALAVAARTYALVHCGKHGEFDLCDRTCCQMYVGIHGSSPRALAAVRATRRLCLWSGSELAYTFYEADCGGLSTSVDEVPLPDKPARPLPYLRPVKDAARGRPDYCASSPYHRWSRKLPAEEVERRLNEDPLTAVGKLLEVRALDYDSSGRIRTVLLRGEQTAPVATASLGLTAPPQRQVVEKRVSGWELRNALGPLTLKSTRLKIDQPQPGSYRFTGAGFGHGLGLCQIGADGMARAGVGFRKILEHYYPGCTVAPLRG